MSRYKPVTSGSKQVVFELELLEESKRFLRRDLSNQVKHYTTSRQREDSPTQIFIALEWVGLENNIGQCCLENKIMLLACVALEWVGIESSIGQCYLGNNVMLLAYERDKKKQKKNSKRTI